QYSISLKLPPFLKNDWETWSKEARRQLASAGLQDVVLGKQTIPDRKTDRKNYATYYDQCQQATSKLIECLPAEYKPKYLHFQSPDKLWSKLQEDFAIKSANLIVQTFKQICTSKWSLM